MFVQFNTKAAILAHENIGLFIFHDKRCGSLYLGSEFISCKRALFILRILPLLMEILAWLARFFVITLFLNLTTVLILLFIILRCLISSLLLLRVLDQAKLALNRHFFTFFFRENFAYIVWFLQDLNCLCDIFLLNFRLINLRIVLGN